HYVTLADDVIHPFNEYLNLVVKYGAIGFVVLFSIFVLFIRHVLVDFESKKYAFFSVLGILIFGFFSYPFQYTTVIIICAVNLWICISLYPIDSEGFYFQLRKRSSYAVLPVSFFLFLLYSTSKSVADISKWKELKRESERGAKLDEKTILAYEN